MIKKLIILLVIVALAVWVRQSSYADLLTFSALKANADALRGYVADNMMISAVIYVLVYIIVAGLNIPGAIVMSLAGGYLFGAAAGTVLAVSGATLGGTFGFISSRYILGSGLNRKYETQLARFNKELSENGYFYMLTLRLIPVFPFFLINIMAGLTRLSIVTFIWTSFIGMLPGGFVFVYAGSRLNEVSSPGDIFSPGMLSAFVLLGLLMLIPVAYKKVKGRG